MAPPSRDMQLIGKYLDGHPAPEELADLQRRLREAPEAAEAFAAAARVDAWLAGHFREEKGARDVAAVFRQVEAGRPAASRQPGAAPRWRSSKVLAAAAVVVLACGAGLWLYLGGLPATSHQVLAGRVMTGGAEATVIPQGARIRVADSAPAVIRLTDGSRATLEASSVAVLHGRAAGRRQLVELDAGGGTFQVAKAKGDFEVKTPLGRVTALGTEFSVRLAAAANGHEKEGEHPRAGRRALAVAVLSGAVQVEFAGQTHTLQAGDSRVFTPEAEKKARVVQCSGVLTAVEASAITVAVKKGERAVAETLTIAVDKDTKVLMETDEMESVPGEGGKMKQRPKVAEGTIADFKIGQQADVTYAAEENRAVRVFIHRPVPPRRDNEETRAPLSSERPGRGKEPGLPPRPPQD